MPSGPHINRPRLWIPNTAATLDAVTGNALRAHALATEGTGADRIVEITRHAIRSWRRLAQLDDPGHIEPASVDNALDT